MDCSDLKDDLLDVLYGEADAATRERVQEHERGCAGCREELAAMRRLRRDLAEWRVAEEPARRPAPSLWSSLPRGLAAAAVLLLATGGALALSGAEIRFDKGPVRVSLGRGGPSDDLKRELMEQEVRHRQEIAAMETRLTTLTATPSTALRTSGEEAVLRRVASLIQESEARQASAMKAGLLELSERTKAQRRYDLARVSAGLSYLDGKTGQQVARTTELMGYVLQASQKR